VSCLTYIITELSGTGLLELENFHYAARRFQDKVADAVYDKYVTKQYGGTGANETVKTAYAQYDEEAAVLLGEHEQRVAAAFVSFLRYDVR